MAIGFIGGKVYPNEYATVLADLCNDIQREIEQQQDKIRLAYFNQLDDKTKKEVLKGNYKIDVPVEFTENGVKILEPAIQYNYYTVKIE